jgi:outer membrane protein assembly factor BamB
MKIKNIALVVFIISFVGGTCPGPVTPNNPPAVPTVVGPSSGWVGVNYPFSTRAIDPDGDSVAYLFDWGDGSNLNWTQLVPNGATVTDTHRWVLPGTYIIRAKAKDSDGDTSAFSSGISLTLDTIPSNAPYQPQPPTGPSTGIVGIAYTFSAVTTDPDDDSVAYQFDWDDGTSKEWSALVPSGTLVSLPHTFNGQGSYNVKVLAKDNTNLSSLWSESHSITIAPANSPPNTPAPPRGPASGINATSYTFYATTTDPDTDRVYYKFDWGDGNVSNWSQIPINSGDTASMNHSFANEGTYQVKVKAKDELNYESGWSNPASIVISRIGYVVWKVQLGSFRHSSPAVGSDGKIYIGSTNTVLYAVSPSGVPAWQFKTTGAIESSPLVGPDGSIYVGSDDGNLYKIRSSGAPWWSVKTGGPVRSSPAIDAAGNIYVGSNDGYLYCIGSGGSIVWKKKTNGPISSSPAIDNNLVYVGSEDKKLYCYYTSGSLKWSYETGGPIKWSSPTVAGDKSVSIGSDDGYLYHIKDGALVSKLKTNDVVESSPAIDAAGTVFFGSGDGFLYGSSGGSWPCDIGGELFSSPAVGSDGIVYIGTSANSLTAINPDGTVLWSWATGGLIYSSPALTTDGIVYVGSDDGYLYAFKGTGQLASSVWPMFRHDLRHSGRVGGP